MIKRKNELPFKLAVKDSPTFKAAELPVPQNPGDVIVGESARYVFKTVQIFGSAETVRMSLAAKFDEAEKSGYRYVDRIPANQTESILVFELNK